MNTFDIKTQLQTEYDNAIKLGRKEAAKLVLLKAYNLKVVINLDNVPREEVGDLFLFDYN